MDPLTIIIADDHKLFRQSLTATLNEYAICTIGEAEDGTELLALLKIHLPDVILLDLEMPEMNGFNSLKNIKTLYPLQKVIVITSYDNSHLKKGIVESGADAFLSKNADIELVAKTIKEVFKNTYKPSKNSPLQANGMAKNLNFSSREAELIPLICEGKSNKEIAEHFKISNKTVEAHKNSLFKKTKTLNSMEFTLFFLKTGLDKMY